MREHSGVRLRGIDGDRGRSGPARAGGPGRRIRPDLVIGGVVIFLLLGMVPSVVWTLVEHDPPPGRRLSAPDPRYASQSGSLNRGREIDVARRAQRDVASAQETCAAVGLTPLAEKYGIPPRPRLVAETFAGGYERVLQERVARACLRGLAAGG